MRRHTVGPQIGLPLAACVNRLADVPARIAAVHGLAVNPGCQWVDVSRELRAVAADIDRAVEHRAELLARAAS